MRRKKIRVAYLYGAADDVGESRIEPIRRGLKNVGLDVGEDDFFVIDWSSFGVNPRDGDRRALLENRFGDDDAAGRELIRRVINAKARGDGGALRSIMAARIDDIEILKPYRDVVIGSYPVIVDVMSYIRRSGQIVSYVVSELTRVTESSRVPVIAIGLSLGGIILVDALPTWRRSVEPEQAKMLRMLVTVGSQAPMLLACDALGTLRRDGATDRDPFTPWLNIWRRLDLLSFPARPMFGARFTSRKDIRDVAVDAVENPEMFPEAHSTYFDDPRVFEEIRQMLLDLRVVSPEREERVSTDYARRPDIESEAEAVRGIVRRGPKAIRVQNYGTKRSGATFLRAPE